MSISSGIPQEDKPQAQFPDFSGRLAPGCTTCLSEGGPRLPLATCPIHECDTPILTCCLLGNQLIPLSSGSREESLFLMIFPTLVPGFTVISTLKIPLQESRRSTQTQSCWCGEASRLGPVPETSGYVLKKMLEIGGAALNLLGCSFHSYRPRTQESA